MLLSLYDNVWKIADFGLTSEDATRRAYTTLLARGTECYRTPELVREESVVTRKSDIWTLGCILFELISGSKAFPRDFNIYEYVQSKRRPNIPTLGLDGRLKTCLSELVYAMFAIDWWERPSTEAILKMFASLSNKTTDILVLNCNGIRAPSSDNTEVEHTSVDGVEVILHIKADSRLWQKVSWRPY